MFHKHLLFIILIEQWHVQPSVWKFFQQSCCFQTYWLPSTTARTHLYENGKGKKNYGIYNFLRTANQMSDVALVHFNS